ncbi:hypothetical protein C8J57DRAFT_1043373, partial [Mycena rebaudengoi]
MQAPMASGKSTHASRNPGKQVQETRGRKKGPLTDSQKATRAAAALKRKAAKALLDEDLDNFHAMRNKAIVDMAKAHDRVPEYIKQLVMSESSIKTTRSMTLRNALMHDFSTKAREGASDGRSLSLTELHQLADVALLKKRTEEEETRLYKGLAAHRALHCVGLRASNASATADTRAVAARIGDELGDLFERTGARGFFFLSRGHADDAAMPVFTDSGDAARFILERLKIQPLDLVRQFEQWSCTQDKAGAKRETIPVLRAQIVKLINERLHTYPSSSSSVMSWDHYNVDIREALQLEIQGWPDMDFKSPWKLNGVERLRTLRDAWINRTCGWVRMTPEQVDELAAELRKRRAAGGGVTKLRKQHSDLGGRHKAKLRSEESEDGDDD